MSQTADDEPVLSLQDIHVHFEDDSWFDDSVVRAVDGVSLDIYKNDIVALVGESGCGKTTFGKTAIGLQRPTRGTIEYRGQDVWSARDATGKIDIPFERIRRALQIIHQDPGSSLNPNRTILANLAVPLKKYRPDMNASTRKRTVHKLLETLGIEPATDYANRFPHQLSGGEQQRVALGRVLMMQPDVILADEAVSALDVSLRVEMMDLLLELQRLFDTSYLVISHDFANARYLTKKADGRIGVMYLGKLVEIGPVDEILNNPKHPYTQVLVWSTPSIDPDEAKLENQEEPPVRSIDIPDPKNPPSGCKFNTRCEYIIPPEGLDIEQSTYNEIVDFRQDLAEGTLDTDAVWADVGVDPEAKPSERRSNAAAFAERFHEVYFDVPLAEPHRSRIEKAIEHVAVDEEDEAGERLREHYESICERQEPELREEYPVACHLYEDTDEPSQLQSNTD